MGAIFTKEIKKDFFKSWTSEMSYMLGYIVADGCISISKDRKKHPFTFNITSADKKHLYQLRRTLGSEHKMSEKRSGSGKVAFQLQIRNPSIAADLMRLGIAPRKTYHLDPIKIPMTV